MSHGASDNYLSYIQYGFHGHVHNKIVKLKSYKTYLSNAKQMNSYRYGFHFIAVYIKHTYRIRGLSIKCKICFDMGFYQLCIQNNNCWQFILKNMKSHLKVPY